MVKLNPLDYRIALIAVLEIEAQAALHMLDHRHDGEFALNRGDDYVFHAGDINGRNVIIATFPAGQNYGTGSAASLASQTKSFFRNLWFGLLVGVAAGLPNHTKSPPIDIRLGDVLVALPKGDSAGLISYDLGKETDNGFELLDGGRVLAKTEPVIRSAIGAIKNDTPSRQMRFVDFYAAMKDEEHDFEFSMDQTFRDPGQDKDKLFSVNPDGIDHEVPRMKRPDCKRIRVWYGPIGSGDKLMKNSQERDRLRDLYGVIGLEMEAAGVLSSLPVGIIRGVCDYGDNHKTKQWQPYAAAMAASYAKAILMKVGQGDEAPLAIGQYTQHYITAVNIDVYWTAIPEANVGCEILCNLPPQTDRFFGREVELTRMTQFLQGTDGQRGAVLCGISGSGKTQLAREYIFREQEKHSAIIWINAASNQTVDQSFFQCAEHILLRSMHIPQSGFRVSDQSVVLDWLRKSRSHNWLVIIDELDDFNTARKLFHSFNNLLSGSGAVCVTSTDPHVGRVWNFEPISIGQLDIGPASSLILWRALDTTDSPDEETKKWIRDAAKVLNRYALGLELAGLLIHEGIVRLDMPPTVFETRYKQLSSIDPLIWNWNKSHTLFDIFDTLYTDLITKSCVVGDLLTLCSIYGPQEISVAFLQNLKFEKTQETAKSQQPWTRLQELFNDEIALNLTITKLHEVFLAHKKYDIDRSLQSFSLNASICQWRFATIGEERAQWIIEALQALALYLDAETDRQRQRKLRQPETFDVFRRFHPISVRCLEMLQKHVPQEELEAPDGLYSKQYYNICLRLAPSISSIGNHGLASTLYSDAIIYLEITKTENLDEAIFPLLCSLARCSKKAGNMTHSEECLQSAGELASKLYGESSDEAVDLYAELRHVRDHINMENDHRKRALIASTGPKLSLRRYHPEDFNTTDDQEFAVAYEPQEGEEAAPMYSPEYMPRHRRLRGGGDFACMRELYKLLDAGLDPNATNYGSTELYAASKNGYIFTARLLLERGATPDLADDINKTPLHAASRRGHGKVVEMLIEKGADVNHADSLGHTPLHLALMTTHRHSMMHWQRVIAEFLIKKLADPNARTHIGQTPLSLSLDHNDTHLFKLLLEYGGDPNIGSTGANPLLHEAVRGGSTEIVRLLMEKGVDPSARSNDQTTLLQMALLRHDFEIIKLLLENGVDVNEEYEYGRQPLHYAAMFNDCKTVSLLLEQGVNLDATDHVGQTPLHYAIAFGDFDTVNLLLERGANLNSTDHEGQTPLHYAAALSEAYTVRLLCFMIAGSIIDADERQIMVRLAETKMMNHLPDSRSTAGGSLASGSSQIYMTDEAGRTPLLIAALHGNLGAAEALLCWDANLTAQDLEGNTCIHLACLKGDLGTVKLFLQYGADWKILNNQGQDALQIAQSHGHDSIADLLRPEGDRPNGTSTILRSALVALVACILVRLMTVSGND